MKNHHSECSEVRERLPLLPGGELEAPLAEWVTAHLETCEPCSAELQRLVTALAALTGVERRDPAIDIWSNVREQLVREGLVHVASEAAPAFAAANPVRARRSVAARWGFWVALAAAAAVVVWINVRGNGDAPGRREQPAPFVAQPNPQPAQPQLDGELDRDGDLGLDGLPDPAALGLQGGVAAELTPAPQNGLRRADGEERLREVSVPFDQTNSRLGNGVLFASDREVR